MIDANSCCGCSACEHICSHHAIKMDEDVLGFLYPTVDEGRCLNCGLCDKVCPFGNVYVQSEFKEKPKAFAVRHKDLREVETSRSGALFCALADRILEEGGIVYGAAFDKSFRVVHKCAKTKLECNEFKGSKYVQSDLRTIYVDCKNTLKEGKTVLFSGTPCQVAALQNYIPTRLKNKLLTVDVICHGVASPKFWHDYLEYLERKERKSLVKVNFRDKSIFGWSGLHRESFTFANGRTHIYPITFYQPFLIRKSCHNCPYASIPRPADITIGDFWGWERVDKTINTDDKGVSLAMLNTPNGQKLFSEVLPRLNVIPVALKDCMQPNLLQPTEESPLRRAFEEDYAKLGFEYALHEYYKIDILEYMKWFVKRILRKA